MKTTNAKQSNDQQNEMKAKTEYSRTTPCSHLINNQLVYFTTANFFVWQNALTFSQEKILLMQPPC